MGVDERCMGVDDQQRVRDKGDGRVPRSRPQRGRGMLLSLP